MIKISSNLEVMKYFPMPATAEKTTSFVERMKTLYNKKGYCYFAAINLKTSETMGFIGLNDSDFEAEFLPNVDIGWRLKPKFWGNGYATEGALRCLEYGFSKLNLKTIISIAPIANVASINIMKKIGMQLKTPFIHPSLLAFERLVDCACYEINRESYELFRNQQIILE